MFSVDVIQHQEGMFSVYSVVELFSQELL